MRGGRVAAVAAVLAAAAGVVLWRRSTSGRERYEDVIVDEGPPAPPARPPSLADAPPPAPTAPRPPREAPREEPETPPEEAEVAITGVVVDDETGKPVAGAVVVAEPSTEPCPRLPGGYRGDGGWIHLRQGKVPVQTPLGWEGVAFRAGLGLRSGPSGEAGSFRIPWPHPGAADLFAIKRPGYVVTTSCAASPGTPVSIRLSRGLSIAGRVVRPDGRAVAEATVLAGPAPGVPRVPGHVEDARSDAEGRFVLTGLLPGPVVLTADHPAHVATALEPMEPGRQDVVVVLVPALVTTFVVSTYDGREPESVSLGWRTEGPNPRRGLQMLVPVSVQTEEGSPSRERAHEPVKVPCDGAQVTFDLKAVGYAPWTSVPPEPLPPEGGEKTIAVTLERDPSLGGLTVALEDRDGRLLNYVEEKAETQMWRRDGAPIPGGIVMQRSDVLTLPSLPAGGYGLFVRSPLHAPVEAAVELLPGEVVERRVVVGPTAKVRVKFTASEAMLVTFRVSQGGRPSWPFREGAATDPAPGEEEAPGAPATAAAGGEGAVFTGLAGGRHLIEVVSPELSAAATPVDLVEGETRDVEIPVSKR